MPMKNIALILISFLLYSCATLPPRQAVQLPSQDITTQAPQGKNRVVFFNDSGFLNYFPVQITIDGKYMGQIRKREYMQLFLPKGTYKVKLLHNDLFSIKSNHTINITDNSYLEIKSGPIDHDLTIKDKPSNFDADFRYAYWE